MKKIISIILAVMFLFSAMAITTSAGSGYTIVSPYKDVIWNGNGKWNAYKGNLHTHSTVSDAEMNFNEMIIEHYNRGYDFLAMTDHGVTGKKWTEEPTHIPLYLYQFFIGKKPVPLTSEEYEAITSGTYKVNGEPRGYGMTCVTNGNELNALTLTKCHVNGMFLPDNAGNNYLGFENDHEGAVKLTENAGGLSFINHPGDWLHSNRDISAVSDRKNVKYFSDIILKYNSCLGMEVFNERNTVTPYDRILWDNVLTECLPYGKNVIGFSNNDAHFQSHLDSSFSVFMMESNTVENIKKTMQSGAFFCVTRILRNNDKIGPKNGFDVRDSDITYPQFTELTVDGHKVTVKAKNFRTLQWIANGNIIASKEISQSDNETTYILDLDAVKGNEDFLYIRCELFGDGGCTLSQALTIDDGSEPMKYVPDTSMKAKLEKILYKITSLRIIVAVKLLIDEIRY